MAMMYNGLFGVDFRNAVQLGTDLRQRIEAERASFQRYLNESDAGIELGKAIKALQEEQKVRVKESIERRELQIKVTRSMVGNERYDRFEGGLEDGEAEDCQCCPRCNGRAA